MRDQDAAFFVVAAAALALYLYSEQQAGESAGVIETVAGIVGDFGIDEMSALQNPNLRAFLMVIRTGEGTANANGYRTLFGGRLFDGFADHPRITVTASGYTSTAAGAYQFLARTWDGLGLPDFSPASQDIGAVMLIKRRGALADVLAGRFETAVRKCNKEWASLPGSPYGQPTVSLERASATFARWGGQTEAFA